MKTALRFPLRVSTPFIVACVALMLTGMQSAVARSQDVPAGFKAKDPGPRPNPKSTVPPAFPGLNANEQLLYQESLLRVSELEDSCDTCNDQPQAVPPIDPDLRPGGNPFSPLKLTNSGGMGPRFNADQCFICHFQPQIGGTSPKVNPAMLIAHRNGGTNTVPSFEDPNGSIREVRFKFNPDGSRDGGVHSLFTLQGRADAPNCRLAQPDFAGQMAKQNLAFRIPLQLFGLGLLEALPDSAILDNVTANQGLKRQLGIGGRVSLVPNNGTVSRFGWKAQNASISIFAGEAYNVEMGINNDVFPTARGAADAGNDGCMRTYEGAFDQPRTVATDEGLDLFNSPEKIMPAWLMFVQFMRFVDQPRPVPFTPSAQRGQQLFAQVGCAVCHTPTYKLDGVANPTTRDEEIGPRIIAFRGKEFSPYSDLLIHHMGATLADNVAQGDAGPDEFRTTPLWGVGTRLFLLHDGRTGDLLTAIEDHSSAAGSNGGDNPSRDVNSHLYGPSEANGVVNNFNRLAEQDKQSILDFLRSL